MENKEIEDTEVIKHLINYYQMSPDQAQDYFEVFPNRAKWMYWKDKTRIIKENK